MPPAATVGDLTSHGFPLSPGPGSFNVLINGKQAWRALSDYHICPLSDQTRSGRRPHIGGVVSIGSATVIINNLPAVRVGDVIMEAGPPDPIVSGSSNVLIG